MIEGINCILYTSCFYEFINYIIVSRQFKWGVCFLRRKVWKVIETMLDLDLILGGLKTIGEFCLATNDSGKFYILKDN